MIPRQKLAAEAWAGVRTPATVEKDAEMINKKIDDYRQRFKTAPVGMWRWATMSYGIIDQDWVFRPDHTGYFTDYGPFGYPRCRRHFQWRELAEFTILIGETEWEDLELADKNMKDVSEIEPEESAEEIEWVTVKYDFKAVVDEYGATEIAMFEVGREGDRGATFYTCYGEPLRYVGPVEEE